MTPQPAMLYPRIQGDTPPIRAHRGCKDAYLSFRNCADDSVGGPGFSPDAVRLQTDRYQQASRATRRRHLRCNRGNNDEPVPHDDTERGERDRKQRFRADDQQPAGAACSTGDSPGRIQPVAACKHVSVEPLPEQFHSRDASPIRVRPLTGRRDIDTASEPIGMSSDPARRDLYRRCRPRSGRLP